MVDLNTQAAYKLNISDLKENTYVKDDNGKEPNYLNLADKIKVYRVRILARVTFKYSSEDGNYASITLDDDTGTIRVKAWQNIKSVLDTKKEDLVDMIALVREWNGEVYLVPEVLRIVDNPDMKTLRRLEILRFKKEEGILDKDTIQKEITSIKTSFGSESNTVVSSDAKSDATDNTIDGRNKKEDNPDTIKSPINEQKSEQVKVAIPKPIENKITSQKPTDEKTTGTQDDTSETSSENTEKPLRVRILEVIEKLDAGDGAAIDDVLESVKGPEKDTEEVINELLSEGTCYEPRAGKIKVL